MLGPSLGQHGPGQMSWEGGGGGNGGKGMMPLVRSPGDSEMVPVSELALTLHGWHHLCPPPGHIYNSVNHAVEPWYSAEWQNMGQGPLRGPWFGGWWRGPPGSMCVVFFPSQLSIAEGELKWQLH